MRYFVEIHELQTELSAFEARGVANFGTRCTNVILVAILCFEHARFASVVFSIA